MASMAPAKIVLKNSTKVSLNDRFTTIMKTRPAVSATTVRAQVAKERLASEKNRRLAQQMERRPTVAAELDNRPLVTVRDRLGNVPSRGRRPARGIGGRFQGRGQYSRSSRGISRGYRGNTSRGRNFSASQDFTRNSQSNTGRGRGTSPRARGRGRGGRRGRGRRGGMRRVPADKDKLDEQLDSYMTKTKSVMNAELDTYMAEMNK